VFFEHGVRDAWLSIEVDEVEVATKRGLHELDPRLLSALGIGQAKRDHFVHPIRMQEGQSPHDECFPVMTYEGSIFVPVANPLLDGVQTIDREELQRKIERGDEFRLVMALNEWAFRAKHIPGSEHFNTPDELFSSLRPDEEVVVYCTSIDCHSSIALYMAFIDAGFANVRRYSGGLSDWEAAGLPLEGDWA